METPKTSVIIATTGKLSLISTLDSLVDIEINCPVTVVTFSNCPGVAELCKEYDVELITLEEPYRGSNVPAWIAGARAVGDGYCVFGSDDMCFTPHAAQLLVAKAVHPEGGDLIPWSLPTFVGYDADGSVAQHLCTVYGLLVPASRVASLRPDDFTGEDHFQFGYRLAQLVGARSEPSAEYFQTYSPAVLSRKDLRPNVPA